ncbi:hypothetical protein HCN44_006309 [Aphidius gifuensis]|uniref:Virilizer N-terminal domain-containing protein n=1 Tax=Aphidius gifuensis TaxID=684658 RepID=A0A834XY26_APHGI|nr:hypothetical protein HCN44_006309 [Aphidius gifuensis]
MNNELLFFDTFSHDISEELNLDLVQFPKPVYISEVRIIPLGARVQADFPGGVRLGATNPSQFEIEFFVNDLSKPGASTFESLGGLEYKQNIHIQLECEKKQIPTDGLVLRGWYTTITLAVYGSLTKSVIAPPEIPAPPAATTTAGVIAVTEETKIPNADVVSAEPQPEWHQEKEKSQKTPTDVPQSDQSKWTPEENTNATKSQPKTPKRPSSPPSESLVSLSPESISAEEEEAERETEEVTEAVEPFEPILSDEELMTDDPPNNNVELFENLPDDLWAIEPPDLLDLQKYPDNIKNHEIINDENTEKIREIIKLLGKLVVNFNIAPGQEKETFVHNCESLVLSTFSSTNFNSHDFDELSKIVNAGLDIELARSQPQPAYKVRHVKVGVRLAESICSITNGSSILQSIDAPNKLLKLCMKENVALPVKLAALRALDSALMYPIIVEEFLQPNNNLYRMILTMLKEAKLARLKYALTSVIRKIHVYELLTEIKQFGLQEQAILELTHAYSCAPTLMAQPKRQLPGSMQMEFERESTRNPRKHLISYFNHFGLLRKILLTLVSPDSSENLVKIIRAFLINLSETGDGLLYLFDEVDVTKVLLKALRFEQESDVGCEIAWRLQVVQCLVHIKAQMTNDNIDWLIIKKLHSFLTYRQGLEAIIAVLPLNNFIDTLISLLSNRDLSEFVAEIISTTIKYSNNVEILRTRAHVLLRECNNGLMRDVMTNLTVSASSANWNYSDVLSLVVIIRKYSEKASSLSGELVTACRILCYLIFPSNNDVDPLEPYVELKHRNALTQLYAADGLTALVAVITNLANFYEQPFLQRATLTGRRGMLLLSVLHSCIRLIRALLEHLVKCMATDFKDLTPVVPLLGIYSLVVAIPCQNKTEINLLADEIAEILLLFTRAVDSDSTGNVAKSLWTQMIGEVLKMISAKPCKFVPGLKLLSRLLPPILRLDCDTEENDINRALGLRKLWSAHLQAQANNLMETLRLLCASWNEDLLILLSAVCKQLSDLAAPTALLVGRCLLDRILAATPLENNSPTIALLGDLTLHPPVKATLLTLMSPTSRAQIKTDQKYPPVVEMMCSAFKNSTDTNVQYEILEIFYTLCDHTLSLTQDNNNELFDIKLTHSVPSKEPLLSILTILIDILSNGSKYDVKNLEKCLAIFLSLTKHNYGLYHVKSCLENNPGVLKTFLEYTVSLIDKENDNNSVSLDSLMMLTIGLLESLVNSGKSEGRSLYLRISQLAGLLMWENGMTQHPLEKIRGSQDLVNDLKSSIEGGEDKEPIPEMLEPLLPTPDALLNQFSQRSIKRSASCSPIRSRKRCFRGSLTSDSISVDLMALATELLPGGFNLLTEAQLLCSKRPSEDTINHLSSKGQNTTTEINRDIQKVPIIPITKTKQPFVTPMRGRAQFVTSRGGMTPGGIGRGADPFRSRPPNTSRPPSLHVDDFVALETCGAQPTGPTGYNKLNIRGTCPPRGVMSGSRCRTWVAEPRPPYLR